MNCRVILVSYSCCNKVLQTLWLFTIEIYSFTEIQNQGVDRATVPLEDLGENYSFLGSFSF